MQLLYTQTTWSLKVWGGTYTEVGSYSKYGTSWSLKVWGGTYTEWALTRSTVQVGVKLNTSSDLSSVNATVWPLIVMWLWAIVPSVGILVPISVLQRMNESLKAVYKIHGNYGRVFRYSPMLSHMYIHVPRLHSLMVVSIHVHHTHTHTHTHTLTHSQWVERNRRHTWHFFSNCRRLHGQVRQTDWATQSILWCTHVRSFNPIHPIGNSLKKQKLCTEV